MRVFFGIIGVITSFIVGLFLGLYVCFVGGGIDIIQEVVNAINGTSVSALAIMWGIVKMAMAGVVGWISCVVLLLPSLAVLGYTNVPVKAKGKK